VGLWTALSIQPNCGLTARRHEHYDVTHYVVNVTGLVGRYRDATHPAVCDRDLNRAVLCSSGGLQEAPPFNDYMFVSGAILP
jgi:hypothetical protein